MDINRRFYEEAIQLELNIAHLYKMFASIHEQDRHFWLEMSQEEMNHASMIRMLEKQFIEGAINLINHPNVVKLADVNSRIVSYVANMELDGVGRKEAFDIAIQLEHQVYEIQFRDIVTSISVPGIKDLFSVLSEKDKEHKDRLIKYVKENYV